MCGRWLLEGDLTTSLVCLANIFSGGVMKTTAYLLGFIFGVTFGASWAFGHLNQWVNEGPCLGIALGAILSFVGVVICLFQESDF